MNLVVRTVKPIANACKSVVRSSAESVDVARRTAQIYGVGKTKAALMRGRAAISGAGKTIMNKMKRESFSFDVLSNAISNLRKKGIKGSKGQLTEALKELGGINDVKAAIKAKGAVGGIREFVKSATRILSSSGLFIAGLFSPIPCGSAVGWVAGEKITEKCLGKPFTKQVQKLIK